jgi:hypothetical protein
LFAADARVGEHGKTISVRQAEIEDRRIIGDGRKRLFGIR